MYLATDCMLWKKESENLKKNLSKPTKTRVQGENRPKRKMSKAVMSYGTISWSPTFVWLCGCKYRQWGDSLGQLVIGRNSDPKFLNLLRSINPQIQEAQQITRKTDTKNTIPRHMIIR